MKTTTLLFLIFIYFTSCKNDKSMIISTGNIISIKSLNEISLGQNDTILVTFSGGNNGCNSPDHLEVKQSDSLITIKAYYKHPKSYDICTDNVPIHNLTYIYKPISKGIITYKSYNSSINSITIVK